VKFRVTDIFTFVATADQVIATGTTNGTNKNAVTLAADSPQAWDINKMGLKNAFSAPTGWDKWEAIYKNYRVLGSQCKLEIFDSFPVNTSGTGGAVPTPTNGYVIGIMLADSTSTIPASNDALIGQGYTKLIKWRNIPPTLVNRVPRVAMGYSPKKLFDVIDPAELDGGTGYATTSTSAQAARFVPFILNQDNQTAITLTGRVVIDYTVEFIQNKLTLTVPAS
jgi:hypothetical protein